ncbi:MAG: hypothetical protein ACLFVR_06325 [Thiohalospira sp.]
MKKIILLITILTFYFNSHGKCLQSYEPIAPLYPQAVKMEKGNQGIFLSKDTYEQVKAFYIKDIGQPATEETGQSKTAFFLYHKVPEKHKMEAQDLGVHIKANTGNEKAIDYILRNYKDALLHNLISQQEYDRIVKRYSYLKNMYYVYLPEKKVSKAMDIYKKYDKKIKEDKKSEEQDLEAQSENIQQLLEEGKVEELAEQMKQMNSSSMDALGEITDVKQWEECLKEIEKNAYRVYIYIMDASNK